MPKKEKFEVVTRSGYQTANGETYKTGDVVEGENLDVKFPNAFKKVEMKAKLSKPTPAMVADADDQTTDDRAPSPGVNRDKDPEGASKLLETNKEAVDDLEDLGTDATTMFDGAEEAGAKVFGKDDGSFTVKWEDGSTEDYDDADAVTAAFATGDEDGGEGGEEKPKAKRKTAAKKKGK